MLCKEFIKELYVFVFFSWALSSICCAAPLPEGALLSKKEWRQCEKFISSDRAQRLFKKGIYFIPIQKNLPCPIQKDPKTGFVYIHLQGRKGAFLGKGSHKRVSKSILYGKKPRIVARCVSNRSEDFEASILEKMKNVPGFIHILSYIHRSDSRSELFVEYYNVGPGLKVQWGELTLPQKDLASICFSLLHALKDLHKAGYIHHDIGTRNIFLYKKHGHYGAVLGDVGYASTYTPLPDFEKLKDPSYPPFRDIYNLGRVFFCLLYQRSYPYTVDDAQQEEIASLALKEKGMRRHLADLAFRMLKFNPLERPSLEEAIQYMNSLLQ